MLREIPQMNGRGVGMLVVALIVFGLMAVSMQSSASSMPAGTIVSQSVTSATNTAWMLFAVTLVAVIGLVYLGVSGSLSYRW